MPKVKNLPGNFVADDKPLVKTFVDKEKQIHNFIKISLSIASQYSFIKLNEVYSSKDKKTFRYRVNFIKQLHDTVLPNFKIVDSRFVEIKIRNSEDSNLEMSLKDLTKF